MTFFSFSRLLPPLTLPLRKVNIPCRRAGKRCATHRTFGLGHDPRFLALMAKQVAECREFAAGAAVLPALGLGAETYDSHLAILVG